MLYILIDKKSGRVLHTHMTREEMVPFLNSSVDFLESSPYADGLTSGMKFDSTTDSFVPLSLVEVRYIRHNLLQSTDWRATVDYPGDDKTAWATYRQALRDLPQDYPDMVGIVFPSEPS